MNVLYIFDEDGKYGGPKAGMEMIMALKKECHINPIIITSKYNEINSICDKNKIENYVTGHHKYTYVKSTSKFKDIIKFFPRYFRYILGNYLAQNKLDKVFKKNKIDLIHCNISGIDLGALLGKKYNIPNILHIREYGEGEQYFRVKSYRKNYIKFLNKYVTKFITISDTVGEFWINKGIENKKVKQIYDGLDLSNINPCFDSKNKNKKLKLIMLGSIHPGKGQSDLILACSKLDESEKNKLSVDIIGNGFKEEENNVNNMIKKYSLDNIISFKNYDTDIRNKLSQYDVGVNCSFAEGFGRVTVEYMRAGLCVIASNRGANEEIIEDNVNGIIYDKNNIESLVEKIRLIMNNEKLRNRISNSAIKDSIKYDINEKCKEIYNLYLECIQ